MILRVIGPGRAGGALALALHRAGWTVEAPRGRGDDLSTAAEGVDLLLVATPDPVVAEVAAAVDPVPTTVVAHVAGALGLEVLAGHERAAALHPLVALPDADDRCRPPGRRGLVRRRRRPPGADGGGRPRRPRVHRGRRRPDPLSRRRRHRLEPPRRPRSARSSGWRPRACPSRPSWRWPGHAGQRRRPGPGAALTGPVARGDWATVDRHLAALPEEERPGLRGDGGRGPQTDRAMKVTTTVAEARWALDEVRREGGTVGLGADHGLPARGPPVAHDGGERGQTDFVIATIFVNPLQFAPGEDLDSYPRDPEGDRRKAEAAGVDLLLVPEHAEMYPEEVLTTVSVGRLSAVDGGRVRDPPTSPAWRRWWPSSSPSPDPAGRTSARRTSSSSRWCGGWRRTSRSRSRWWAARSSASPTGWPCRVATPT